MAVTRVKRIYGAALAKKKEELFSLQKRYQQQQLKMTELTTRLQLEEQQAEEKLTLVVSARDELLRQFKNLAGQVFEERNTSLASINRQGLQETIEPFKKDLDDFRKKVEDIHIDDIRERSLLKKELEQLRDLNSRISKEAVQLTNALKGDKKVQGSWGELVLERVLEMSGLRKGQEYDVQGGFRDQENRLFRPDAIVHLPGDRDVIIDSKVSLSAWERYVNSDNEAGSEQELKSHVAAIRKHIFTLSEKDYSSLPEMHTIDFVLMFLPIEAACQVALHSDDTLLPLALDKKIVIVSPTTLLATLKTIENLWRTEQQNKNTLEIARRAAAMYDKFCGFAEDLERVGKQLATVQNSYDSAVTKLISGRGSLVSQAIGFRELGVKAKKELPVSFKTQNIME